MEARRVEANETCESWSQHEVGECSSRREERWRPCRGYLMKDNGNEENLSVMSSWWLSAGKGEEHSWW